MSRSFLLVAATFLVGVPCAQAQSALPPAVDAFVSSANALAKSAGDAADLGRTNSRLDIIHLAVTAKLATASPEPNLRLSDLDEGLVLCGPRTKNLVLTAQRNYLQAVAAKIDEVGKPSQIDNLSTAVKSLFASQSIDVKNIPDQQALEKVQHTMMSMCQSDLKLYDAYFFGRAIEEGAPTANTLGLSAFGPFFSLADTIISLITPIVIDGAKIVDEEKRRKVVLAFLSNPDNINRISSAGQQLAQHVSEAVLAKRRTLAGTFNQALALLRTKSVDLSKLPECKSYLSLAPEAKFARRPSGAPNDGFVSCWGAVWLELGPLVSSVLKSANDYDQLADAGDSDNASKAFAPLSKSLDAIVKDQNNMSAENLTRIWNLATELVAFAEKVNAAASPENQKKLKDAIDALVKAN